MVNTTLLILVAATAGVTLALSIKYPDLVYGRFVSPIDSARTLIGLVLGGLAVWYALNTGVAWMVGVALLGVAFVTGYLYFEEPHHDIK